MAEMEIKLDRRGIRTVLANAAAAELNRYANHIRDNLDIPAEYGDNIEVEVHKYRTDRGAAAVVIHDHLGLEIQAKHGSLTRAALAVGLEVKDR